MSTASITQRITSPEINTSLEQEICREIHCEYNATCEIGNDKLPRCSCKFDCNSIVQDNAEPICASDHIIYPSKCAMMMQACQRQQDLRLRPMLYCEGYYKFCNFISKVS